MEPHVREKSVKTKTKHHDEDVGETKKGGKHHRKKTEEPKNETDGKKEKTGKKKKKSDTPLVEYNTEVDPSVLPPVWKRENFSEEQNEKIIAFRNGPAKEFIKPELSDLHVARWLIARKWDVNLSTKMFIESMKWREQRNIDTIISWIPTIPSYSFLSAYWPTSILMEKNTHRLRTFDGHQIIFEKLGLLSPSLLKAVSLEDLENFLVYRQELAHLERQNILFEEKKVGDTQYAPCVFIQDLGGLTMSHLNKHCNHLIRTFTECESNNYPETIRKVYIVNVPSVFSVGWKIVKAFLDPATLEKISILDSDSFRDELKKVIPLECLPIEYGGTLDYNVPGGGSLKEQKNLPPLTKIHVHAELSITLHVDKASKIRYQFQKKMNDVSVEFYYHTMEDSKKELIHEIKKEDTDDMVVDRTTHAEKSGFYTLKWVNHSHAFLPIKRKIRYLISLDNVVLTEKDFVKITPSK